MCYVREGEGVGVDAEAEVQDIVAWEEEEEEGGLR
jgi:hypothetical protein